MPVAGTGAFNHIDAADMRSDAAPGLDARLSSAAEREFDAAARKPPKSPIYELPVEMLAEILSHVSPQDLRDVEAARDLLNAAGTDQRFHAAVMGDTRLKSVYFQAVAAGRVAHRMWTTDHPESISPGQLFRRAVSAQKAAQQLLSDGALNNPKDDIFHLALLQLTLHARYLPRLDEILAHPSKEGALMTSHNIDLIVRDVVNAPDNDAAYERNLHALVIRSRYLSKAQKADLEPVKFRAYTKAVPKWDLLHAIAADDSKVADQTRENMQTRWAGRVLSIEDERERSYAIRVADPARLLPGVVARLAANAEAMTKYRGVTQDHLDLGRQN
jgi:hypothetical protein